MKNIVIWGVSSFNWLWVPLAEELKRRHGARIHFIVTYPEGARLWKDQDKSGAIDSFTSISRFFFEYDKCADPPDVIYRKARQYEKRLNTLAVDALQTDRHLGRGFFPLGPGHPKSELSKKADYLKSVDLFNKVCAFWEDYFEKTKPDLIIGTAANFVGKIFSSVARYHRVPMRVLSTSGYKSYYHWAVDEYYYSGEFEKNFKSIRDARDLVDEEEVSSIKRYFKGDWGYKEFDTHRSHIKILKEIINQLKVKAYRRYRHIVTMGNYGLFENIRFLYSVHRDLNSIGKLKTARLDDLAKMSYVLYPLQEEPEAALGMFSPEFNEQLAIIELIAKNLPAGTKLVVKEHIFAVGRRPKDFYAILLDIPNVEMLSVYEYASEAARMARCVATISSTVGIEAVIMGVPVITFGVHNNYNFLPYVRVIESWKELRPLLAGLCAEDSEDAKRKRSEDGLRYLAALKTSSMDLSGIDYISRRRGPATEKECELFYSTLMRSLDIAEHEYQGSGSIY